MRTSKSATRETVQNPNLQETSPERGHATENHHHRSLHNIVDRLESPNWDAAGSVKASQGAADRALGPKGSLLALFTPPIFGACLANSMRARITVGDLCQPSGKETRRTPTSA